MEWIFLASVILGVIESINSSATTNKNLKKINNKYQPILSKIQQDNQLINELESAYQKKDANLVQSILMASPFSSDIKRMRDELTNSRAKQQEISNKKVSMAKEQAEINNAYNEKLSQAQSTGSIIGDIARGGVALDNKDYVGSGYSDTDLKEVYRL